MYTCGPLLMDEQRLDQLEPLYNCSVPTQDVAWRTWQERWMIETSGERESWKHAPTAQHDDDNPSQKAVNINRVWDEGSTSNQTIQCWFLKFFCGDINLEVRAGKNSYSVKQNFNRRVRFSSGISKGIVVFFYIHIWFIEWYSIRNKTFCWCCKTSW